MTITINNDTFYIEPFIIEKLDFLKAANAKNWDGFVLIDGVEGSGKSTFAKQICYYLDPNFNIDNIVFTPDQFSEAVDKAERGTAILWDEFSLAGLSTDAMTKIQSTILKKTTTIRSKGLYVVLLISWFFELRKYFAVGRTRFLLHTYTPDGISRGYFKYWAFDGKRQLYFKGRKNYEYNVLYDKKGRFIKFDPIPAALYEAKKEAAVKSIDFANGKEHKWKEQRDKAINLLLDTGVKNKDISKHLNLANNTISDIRKARSLEPINYS